MMKKRCGICSREITLGSNPSGEKIFSFTIGLGSECWKKISNGDADFPYSVYDTRHLAKQMYIQKMEAILKDKNHAALSQQEQIGVGLWASMATYYEMVSKYTNPATRSGNLEVAKLQIHTCVDNVFDGTKSALDMNAKLYEEYKLHANGFLFDKTEKENFQSLLGQALGVKYAEEKSPEDFLWSEYESLYSKVFPFANAGIIPKSPIDIIMASSFFKALTRSFTTGTVGVDIDTIKKFAKFESYALEDEIVYNKNIFSDVGFGFSNTKLGSQTVDSILIGNAWLRTGKDDNFNDSIDRVTKNIVSLGGIDDEKLLKIGLDLYRTRIKSGEQRLFRNPFGKGESLKPRSINELAPFAKGMVDLLESPNNYSPADPAIITFAPVVRELEEQRQAFGMAITFSENKVGYKFAKGEGFDKIKDPFQRACAIFKDIAKSQGHTDFNRAVEAQNVVVLVNSLSPESGNKRTVAFSFELQPVSNEMAKFRNLTSRDMLSVDGRLMGMTCTETWQMSHRRDLVDKIATIDTSYKRVITATSPAEEKELKYFSSRHGRLADSISFKALEDHGTWIRHYPAPSEGERQALSKLVDKDDSMAETIGNRILKIYKEIGHDPTDDESE